MPYARLHHNYRNIRYVNMHIKYRVVHCVAPRLNVNETHFRLGFRLNLCFNILFGPCHYMLNVTSFKCPLWDILLDGIFLRELSMTCLHIPGNSSFASKFPVKVWKLFLNRSPVTYQGGFNQLKIMENSKIAFISLLKMNLYFNSVFLPVVAFCLCYYKWT